MWNFLDKFSAELFAKFDLGMFIKYTFYNFDTKILELSSQHFSSDFIACRRIKHKKWIKIKLTATFWPFSFITYFPQKFLFFWFWESNQMFIKQFPIRKICSWKMNSSFSLCQPKRILLIFIIISLYHLL